MSVKELMLRTSTKGHRSYGGFQWPEAGPVEAPDWDPYPIHGGGLHGAARGEGNGYFFNWDESAVWQVVEYDPDEAVDLKGQIKVPRGVVVYSGDRETATRIIQDRYPGAAVIGGTVTAGRLGVAATGDFGTSSAGDRGTAIAGGYGIATAGNHGTAHVGECGTAIAGNYGTAIAGDNGIAIAGYGGTVAAGMGGIIQIAYYGSRRRIFTGHVDEDGLCPGVRYFRKHGRFVEVSEEMSERG